MSTETGLVGAAGKGQATGSPLNPTAVQGSDGVSAERLATFTEQETQTAALEAIRDASIPGTVAPTNFVVTATTTPATLAAHACRRVLIVAEASNTQPVRVGGASTSTTIGIPLYPQGSREYEIDNSSKLTVCAVSGSQTLNVEVIP